MEDEKINNGHQCDLNHSKDEIPKEEKDINSGIINLVQDESIYNERYRAFLEQVSDGVYETDIHGNFTYFNQALCNIFGYPRDEILGKNFSHFMDKTNARKAYQEFTKIWVTHKGFSALNWEIIDKDGNTRIIELSAHLIIDENEKKRGFRGIARDITLRHQTISALKESELRYQRAYEASRRAEKWAFNLLDFFPYPIVVFSTNGIVTYLNPAFTDTFGWTLAELRGKQIPYVPPGLEQEHAKKLKNFLKDKLGRYETRRLTKDGRVLDVNIRGVIYSETGGDIGGEVVCLRDVTEEKRMKRTTEALLRISMALPAYPQLEGLLDYISAEIKRLLNTEGALVPLLDETTNEAYFLGAAYDDSRAQRRFKTARFPVENTVTGRVIRTGNPVIIEDTSKEPDFNRGIDRYTNLYTRDMVLVPLRSSDKIIGVLIALNKKEGTFNNTDLELLNMIAGTVALSIENARYSEEIKEAYQEVSSLNRAKDKVINHLSHELKTPISVLLASLNILRKKIPSSKKETLIPTIERAERNLDRILEIQYEVEDIMRDKDFRSYRLISLLLDECTDALEALAAEILGEDNIMNIIRKKVEELFGPRESEVSEIDLENYVRAGIDSIKSLFAHRNVEIVTILEKTPSICIPSDVLKKVLGGLIRNAVENTPDEGRVDIIVSKKGEDAQLVIHDFGVGITEDNQKRIFEGFFTTRETMDYSSKRPFDFNAGGKGADLLRMKIFSERYNFRIHMESTRCHFIPEDSDVCPGNIDDCDFCKTKEDCQNSGETTFSLIFPSQREENCLSVGETAKEQIEKK